MRAYPKRKDRTKLKAISVDTPLLFLSLFFVVVVSYLYPSLTFFAFPATLRG
ncbi:hypothetical protein M128_3407 [Bacteroides fragilis str. S6L8]|uniref:Transmembrane protein n=1 Tax=Bacteroides fragilis str. S36L11 TaxID=1339327 RepID=A0A015Y6T9_BACFG|nr:hypothetical protein M074_3204 [Bacteroides fragilis str. DS-166]EXZ09226.1 hypothetical protein M073_2903 [Bacteroides fragilis str. DS-71]EXZ27642.1 hypothetical protein M136_3208 [Bacteroides fragilis str. S36L11]EXZ67013.1 hypothetical protein M120_3435 [Bacteroides fragilis str. 3783N1-8]EXZ88270.1 hypothetical protein M068_3165 [Bacteroides fragilis str. J38-1]EYA08396.1 hypothetical protein M130_3345 [Bacteroides fragilis str. S6R6]EYA29195.1 hypothetical protein M106_2323 [Bacteroi